MAGAGGDRALAMTRAILAVLVLLAAGGALYSGFVEHVLDRGDAIVDISAKSKAARPPLQLGVSGLLCFAASGLVSFAKPLRGRQWSPLLGLGLPLVPAGLVGLTAFSVGRTSLMLALFVAAPPILTMAVACLVPPRPRPGLGRFLLRSWMATGFLLGLTALALFGLEVAEAARPRVPWASVFAALALGTLLQLAARYVGTHGAAPSGLAVDHRQVRQVHEGDEVRDVATRLHPFVEEGRGQDAYAELAQRLGEVARQKPPASAQGPAGAPALPSAQAAAAAILRAAAIALPLVPLVPILGGPAALAAFGLALPFARLSLNPRKEPTPRAWWLAGCALLAAAGAWGGSHLAAPGFERLTLPFAAALATPYLGVFLVTLRPREAPGHLGYLRLEHAQRLAASWRRQVARGLGVAVAALTLPVALGAVRLVSGLKVAAVPWPVLLAFAAAGGLWAAAGALTGPACARHRAALAAQHAQRVQARAAAHRAFLDRLEMT